MIKVVLEIGGTKAAGVAWFRKADDYNYINIAELDAVSKGLNSSWK